MMGNVVLRLAYELHRCVVAWLVFRAVPAMQ